MSHYCQCPRCGERGMEKLETYSHCANCLYYEDYWTSPESDVIAAQNVLREIVEGNNDEDRQSNVVEFDRQQQIKTLKGA